MYPAPTHSNKVNDDLRAYQGSGGGYCLRCGRPWIYIEPQDQHVVDYNGRSGVFVLCQPCHQSVFYDEATRVEYYLKLIEHWVKTSSVDVTATEVIAIVRTVLNEEEFNDGLGGRSL